MKDEIDRLASMLAESQRVVIFTGAGVSTESGIPDFRSPGGLWDRYDPEDFYFQRFLASESAREKYWRMHTELYRVLKEARPNPAHYACVEIRELGKLECVITQNIDNLHQEAGLPKDMVVELHGNALKVVCLDCGKDYTREEIQGRLDLGERAPRCDSCGGILKPATISFGQAMPQEEMSKAEYHAGNCDLFIVVGSSLVVHPAAMIPLIAKRSGARLVIVNLTHTPYDSEADLVIRGRAGEVLHDAVAVARARLKGSGR